MNPLPKCRMCRDPSLHLHTSDTTTRPLYEVIGRKEFKLRKIRGVCFAPAAVSYGGKWWRVDDAFVASVWPRVRARLLRSPEQGRESQDEEQQLDQRD